MEILQLTISTLVSTGIIGILVKGSIDKKLQKFNNELQKALYEHQVKYSKLYNDRAEVIKQFYSNFAKMERAMNDLVGYTTQEKADEALSKILDLKYHFEENRIYFPKELSNQIEKVINTTHNSYFDASHNSKHQIAEITNEKMQTETIERRLKGWKVVKETVPELKEKIEEEFRSLLGIKMS